jgi:hypothetical protein
MVPISEISTGAKILSEVAYRAGGHDWRACEQCDFPPLEDRKGGRHNDTGYE